MTYDPFLPLSYAQAEDAEDVKLFTDELKGVALGISLLVRRYVSVTGLEGLDKLKNLPKFNDLLVDFTTTAIAEDSMTINKEDYSLVLSNVDLMLFTCMDIDGGKDS